MILILTAGYGEGHNAAARALAAGFAALGVPAEVRDLFSETYGATQETSRRLYLDCIERAPWLWSLCYRAMDRLPLMRLAIAPSLFAMQRRLAGVLAERKPRAVVSVYPAYGYLLDRLFPNGAPFSRHTLVTDSITVNSIWHRAGSDTWLVPNDDTAAVLRDARVPAGKIHATGFPVPLVFADARPVRPAPGPLRVLYMINHGQHAAPGLVRQLLALDGVKVTATFGRDAALGRTLAALGGDLELHGWTPRMPELLMSHHILIGKAGGAATQEALAARTPMLITKIVPGQEEGNAELVLRHGCGAITTTPGAIVEKLRDLTADGFALWHRWHDAICRISKPDSARDAARFILASLQ